MAGMSVRRPGGAAPPGYEWDDAAGAYRLAGAKTRDAAAYGEATRPKFETDPMGRVHQFSPNADGAGVWQQVGTAGSAMDGLSAVGRGSGGGAGSTAPDPRFLAKIDELWNKGPITVPDAPVYTAPTPPALDPQITPGERAQLTSSKERTGLRLQAGMKALNDQMAGGDYLFGSGKHSRGMAALVQQAMGDMEETERGLLGSRTQRVRDLEDVGYQGQVHAANQNFGGQQAANAQRVQAQIASRNSLAQLLSYYGMAY